MKHSSQHGQNLPEISLTDETLFSAPIDPLTAMRVRQKRARARRRRLWVWTQTLGFGLASLLLMVTIFSVHAEHSRWQARVSQREDELAALQTQLNIGQKRLVSLQSPQGRKQLLVENGYLRPGDRILEFPASAEETRQAALPPNDLAPHSDNWNREASTGSIWQRAWSSLHARLANWRGAGKAHIAAAPQ